MDSALENREYCGTAVKEFWSCQASPWYAPFVVGCCRPCALGIEFEEIQTGDKNSNLVCPTTHPGCAFCCLVSYAGPGCFDCYQGSVSTTLARKSGWENCFWYSCWNCWWPCSCGPCVTYSVVHDQRKKSGTTMDRLL